MIVYHDLVHYEVNENKKSKTIDVISFICNLKAYFKAYFQYVFFIKSNKTQPIIRQILLNERHGRTSSIEQIENTEKMTTELLITTLKTRCLRVKRQHSEYSASL